LWGLCAKVGSSWGEKVIIPKYLVRLFNNSLILLQSNNTLSC
jgi:hypothetical protein